MVRRLRWQLIADHNEWLKPYTTTRRFLFELVGMISLDRWLLRSNNKFVICFAWLIHLIYMHKTERILQFWEKKKILDVRNKSLTTCAGNWLRTITSGRTVFLFLSNSCRYDVTGQKLLTSNKLIICFAWVTFKHYNFGTENFRRKRSIK